MRIHQIGRTAPKSMLLLAVCFFLLAACGSSTSTGSAPSNTSATATACAQTTRPTTAFRTAVGVLKSISGQTLVLTNAQGKDVNATYTSSTIFTQEVQLAPGDLKEGTSVRVAVTSAGGTYTAVSVLASTGTGSSKGGGFGGFPGFNGTPGAGKGAGNNPCSANRGRLGKGPPGASTNGFRGLIGTVSQVNGTTLVITDSAGASYTVTLTAQTQIIETKTATSAALKVGEPLTVIGKPGDQSTVTASTIAILLKLPTRVTPAA